MRYASPWPISPPNSLITAAQQAGNAPICSGSTTCCATTSPFAFMSAQEASCDSRTMVEKPVRNSEFCISCTMPDRLALITSRSTASTCRREGLRIGSTFLCHDQVLPLVDARELPGMNHRGAIKLIEDGRTRNREADINQLALVDRALDVAPVEADQPHLAPGIGERRACRLEARQLDRRHEAEAAHPVGHDLHRLLRRHVAEHRLMLLVELAAQPA